MKIERVLVISKEITDKICAKIIKHRLPIFNFGEYFKVLLVLCLTFNIILIILMIVKI